MEKNVRLSYMEHDKDKGSDVEIPIHFLPFPKRMLTRLKLIFRRFTGKRVYSDDILWFDESFFLNTTGQLAILDIAKSRHVKRKLLGYHFNVLISK